MTYLRDDETAGDGVLVKSSSGVAFGPPGDRLAEETDETEAAQ